MKAEESGGGQSVLFQPNLLPLRRMSILFQPSVVLLECSHAFF